ncbi:MAG: hypothetical protein HC914_18890, partial [Chloroflexaceae bacterium]|nr:hypothetical protein [Chloroflexaceae bacterium]
PALATPPQPQPANHSWGRVASFVVGLATIVACIAAVVVVPEVRQWVGLESSPFSYQVRVQDANTGDPIERAEVIVEVGGLAPLNDFTDSVGIVRISIDGERANQPGRVIVRANGYQSFERNIDLTPGTLPDVVQLDAVPEP